MTKMRWFLPETPDVLGLLCDQAAVTVDGMDALVAWARGEPGAAERVREREHAADDRKRELRRALTVAFSTPFDAEDLYVMSERLDSVMNGVKDAVRESEVMATPPDEAVGRMVELIAEGVRHLAEAFARLGRGERRSAPSPTDAADAAVASQRRLEKVYRTGMSALLGDADLRTMMARRELYRRFARISEDLTEAADRVWYATVKEG
jgi:uncharacterized protein Yka (UPF0111/DUF47 family)